MPSTTNYFTNLKTQAEAAASAKKAAYDAQLAMATGATVDKTTGVISYAKDAAGNPKYGTEDVAYQAKQRSTKTGAESSGMLRSGQLASESLSNEAAYRSRIAGLASDIAAQKTTVDTETATKIAEYQALYGGNASSSPSTASSPTQKKEETGMQPITPVPTLNTPIPGQSTVGLSPSRVASEYKTPAAPSKSPVTTTPSRVVAEYKAPAKLPKAPATLPKAPATPKKTPVVPKRIGGL